MAHTISTDLRQFDRKEIFTCLSDSHE